MLENPTASLIALCTERTIKCKMVGMGVHTALLTIQFSFFKGSVNIALKINTDSFD
jgi:hypothetical protein